MLNEIIEAIGYDNILDVIQNSNPSGLYIRIPLDREIDEHEDVLLIKSKDEIDIRSQKLFEWFKIRKLYSSYINSNKAITQGKEFKYPKLITTNQTNAIKFNLKTLLDKAENKYKVPFITGLQESIKEFCDILESSDKYKYYQKSIDIVNRLYEDLEIDKTTVINIYLDIPLDEYILEYNKYLNDKLFDGNVVDGKGVLSIFSTSNSEKPHLFMRDNIYNNRSAYKTNRECAERLLNLKKYLMIRPTGNIEYKNGIIKYKCEKGDVVEYEYIPYKKYDIFEENPLYIADRKIDSLSMFYGTIMQLLGKGQNAENFKVLYDKYYSNLNNTNLKQFKSIYNKMIGSLYQIGSRNIKDIYKMSNIISFHINTSDYFFNTNMKEEFNKMRENIIKKILNLKGSEYIIESDNEYWYLIGALGEYLTSKSKSSDDKYMIMKMNYCKFNTKNQILNKLCIDFDRYKYCIQKGSRVEKIYSAILNYSDSLDEDAKINKLKLQQGLFETNKIIYVKGEDKNDEK